VCGGVELIDRYLDGRATFEEMAAVGLDAARGYHDHAEWCRAEASNIACSGNIQGQVAAVLRLVREADRRDEMDVRVRGRDYAIVARCAFGNPFRSITFSPSWRTDTVRLLAQQMYESRDFSAIPILADALQDAGCDSDDILSHCRGEGPHVRGCWVIDLVTGVLEPLGWWPSPLLGEWFSRQDLTRHKRADASRQGGTSFTNRGFLDRIDGRSSLRGRFVRGKMPAWFRAIPPAGFQHIPRDCSSRLPVGNEACLESQSFTRFRFGAACHSVFGFRGAVGGAV
jgi:hypothetical protein